MSWELADDLQATRKRISELEAQLAEKTDDLLAVEDALVVAGYWGQVNLEVQTFVEAIELMAQNLAEGDRQIKAAREALETIGSGPQGELAVEALAAIDGEERKA